MPEAKRPDPKRRSAASRPGKPGAAVRRPRAARVSRPAQTSTHVGRGSTRTLAEQVVEPIKRQIAQSVEQRADQRLGFTARRAAVLAALTCVLTLTIAGPVRTYFAQRTEMDQLTASEAALRRQITELEQQKDKLADPAYIAAQARERLGFVMPGDTPFQVQLPHGEAGAPQPGSAAAKPAGNQPWYTALWHTIADDPHLPPAKAPQPEAPQPEAPQPEAPQPEAHLLPAEPGPPGSVPPSAPYPAAPGG